MAAREKRRKKKAAASLVGLTAPETHSSSPPAEVAGLARAVEEDGGAVLSAYREPFGGRWLLLVSLPIDLVQPTPYQRDISKLHVGKLGSVIERVGRFLGPVL